MVFQWRSDSIRDDLTLSERLAGRQVGAWARFRGENHVDANFRVADRVSGKNWRHLTWNPVRGSGNAGRNFFVEIVFYEWEFKPYDYGHHYDGQAGDVGGLAATRELFAGTFCDLHDAVDGGISFLLFVGAVGGCHGDDSAGGAFAAGAGVRLSPQSSQRAQRRSRSPLFAVNGVQRSAQSPWPLKKEKQASVRFRSGQAGAQQCCAPTRMCWSVEGA